MICSRLVLHYPYQSSSNEDDLKDTLIQTGIESPFSFGTGAFCGLFTEDSVDCNKLKIDKVIQKTVIDVNEKGVEAAAVIMAGVEAESAEMPPTDEPVPMTLD